MMDHDIIVVNRSERLAKGMKDAIFSRVCNKFKCELIPLNVEKHGVDKNKLLITGLAITHNPRSGILIPKETFLESGNTLIGKPMADGHGDFPWDDIKIDEILGVVVDEWYDDEYEAQMFKAEVWDEKAIQVLKSGMYTQFSVAYYFDYKNGTMINQYDEEEDVIIVTKLDYDHIAFLNSPQVPEAEVKTIEQLSCNKREKYMDSVMYSGNNADYLRKVYKHTSSINDKEYSWEDIDITRLPSNAFANMDELDDKKKSTWKYPHHWVNLGDMYLHKGGLIYSLAAGRNGTKASKEELAHLVDHINAINLGEEEITEELQKLKIQDQDIEEILTDLNQTFGGSDMAKEEEKTPEVVEEVQETPKVVETPEEVPEEEQTPEEETPEEEPEQESTPEEEPVQEPKEANSTTPKVEETVTETLADNDPSIVDKVAQMGVELNNKDNEIAGLKEQIAKFETEKLEKQIDEKVSGLLKEGKILPAKKDETIALYKTMTPEQWKNFDEILEKNSAVPIGEESGGMDEDRSNSEKDSKEPEKEKGFYN